MRSQQLPGQFKFDPQTRSQDQSFERNVQDRQLIFDRDKMHDQSWSQLRKPDPFQSMSGELINTYNPPHFSMDSGGKLPQVSSSVELSSKFTRQRNEYPQHQPYEEKKRANTLDAVRNFESPYYFNQDQQQERPPSKHASSLTRADQRRQNTLEEHNFRENQTSMTQHQDVIQDCIQEEHEQSCSSRPSHNYTARAPSQELVELLDFTFFRNVYNAYNTIWQYVMKLPIYGDNLVKREEFVRVLKSCNVMQDGNVFCNFLLFSCSSQLKSRDGSESDAARATMLLIDFRLFLKSIFMTLKRQFNRSLPIGGNNDHRAMQERIFHAEIFLVDHFWQYICQTEHLNSKSGRHDSSKDSVRDYNDSGLDKAANVEAESITMEILQRKMFEFFDRRSEPFLLQINEIELILTECFKNLIERNKRKDLISKRTFKKVISRQCHGILSRALTSFAPPTIKIENTKNQQEPTTAETHTNLKSFSLPTSPVTDSGRVYEKESQRNAVGRVVDHNQPSTRQVNHSRSSSRPIQSYSLISATGKQNTDLRELRDSQEQKDQTKSKEKIERKAQSQPAASRLQQKPNLCKQLEIKIVTQKLQSAIDSFKIRLAFAAISKVETNKYKERQEEANKRNENQTLNDFQTKSSEGIEVQIEGSDSHRRITNIPTTHLHPVISSATQQLKPSGLIVSRRKTELAKPNSNHDFKLEPQKNSSLAREEQTMAKSPTQTPFTYVLNKTSESYSYAADFNRRVRTTSVTGPQQPNSPSFISLRHPPIEKKVSHKDSTFSPSDPAASPKYPSSALNKHLYQRGQAPVSPSHHLFSLQEQSARYVIAGAQTTTYSDELDIKKVYSSDKQSESYRASSLKKSREGSCDQKGNSRKQLLEQKGISTSNISDQKVPSNEIKYSCATESEVLSQGTTSRSVTERGASGSTAAMLKNILKHETQNQNCLKELVQRISDLEESNKMTQNRKQSSHREQHSMHQQEHLKSPPNFSHAAEPQPGIVTFQPLSSERNRRQQYYQHELQAQQIYKQEQNYPQVQVCEDSERQSDMQQQYGQVTSEADQDSKASSRDEFTYRQADKELLYQMVQYQLEQPNNYHRVSGQRSSNQTLKSQKQNSTDPSVKQSRHLHSQNLSQEDLDGKAENFQQNFYEVSREEDRGSSNLDIYGDEDYGEEAEMDFEANKEQRPLQLIHRDKSSSAPDLSASSSYISSQNNHIHSNTISDPYIHTNVQSNTTSQQLYQYDMPYLVTTTNSHSQSGQNGASISQTYQTQHNNMPMQQPQAAASLTYTASDSNKNEDNNTIDQQQEQHQRVQPNIVTSAPNLQIGESINIEEQARQLLQPYSDREKDNVSYDPHNYVSSERLDAVNSQQSPIIVHTLAGSKNNAKEELIYLKKYRKAKKHLKTLLRERRDAEDRTSHLVNENAILQSHLEKTAQSAQEVSNHNQMMQNEVRAQKIFYLLRGILRQTDAVEKQNTLRKTLLLWHAKAKQSSFLQEQHQHQEIILNELSRHQHNYKDQLHFMQQELFKAKMRERQGALNRILRNKVKQLRVSAFASWKTMAVKQSDHIEKINLQEDLHQVVTQLNQFRIQLVFQKLKSSLQRGIRANIQNAFYSIRENQKNSQDQVCNKFTPQQNHSKPPAYKSPFMQHLAKTMQNSDNMQGLETMAPGDTISTVLPNNHNDSVISRGVDYKRNKSSLSVDRRITQNNSQLVGANRSMSGLIVPHNQDKGLIGFNTAGFHSNNEQDESSSVDPYEVHDDRPLAPRQQINYKVKLNNRSRSDIRPSKKEDFRMRMDDRMQKMRSQGRHVDGLVKLHGFFTKVNERVKSASRQLVLSVLFNNCYTYRHTKRNGHDDSRLMTQQDFPITTKHRSSSHNFLGQSAGGAVHSLTSSYSVSQRNCNPVVSSWKVSTGSLHNFSSQNYRETPHSQVNYQVQQAVEAPREKIPIMHERETPIWNDFKLANARHQRTSSENRLEPPRIMMGISPSMHNIHGPAMEQKAQRPVRKKSIPKPKKWMP